MKFRLSITYIIFNGDTKKRLARLHCSGTVSTNMLPRVGETVCLEMSGGDSAEDHQKVTDVYYDLVRGVMTPDVYLQELERDLNNRIDEGEPDEVALASEIRWVKKFVIPALKRQGFTSFVWADNP